MLKNSAYFKYITALLLFGSNGIVASFIDLNSHEIVLLRTFIGSLLLIILYTIVDKKHSMNAACRTNGRLAPEPSLFRKIRNNKKDLFCLTISGMAMGTSWMFLYEAYAQIGVSLASLLYYCGPVIVILLSPLVFNEKLTSRKVLGFLAVLLGIFLVNGSNFNESSFFGIFCGIMSAVMYSLMVIFNKKAAAITGLENSTLQLLISFLTVALFTGTKQGYHIQIAPSSIFPILFLGLVNTGIGCCFYFSSIGRLPVHTVAICGYLEPLSAVLFSVLFLHETLLFPQIVGAILIIGGAIFADPPVNHDNTACFNQ